MLIVAYAFSNRSGFSILLWGTFWGVQSRLLCRRRPPRFESGPFGLRLGSVAEFLVPLEFEVAGLGPRVFGASSLGLGRAKAGCRRVLTGDGLLSKQTELLNSSRYPLRSHSCER